ncbi:MAG TPA: phosphoglycerate dehydrogenase [Longimicrobiales bacterium]|nr:phosphoglycerate dehydrogenase [Longimicrobiales bacterium]
MAEQVARWRVLVADPLPDAGLAPLADERFELVRESGLSGEALARALAAADAVIVRSETRITADVLPTGGRLRVIGRAGVGVDNIDVQAATARGVAVMNAPAGNTISAAELTFALLLAAVRRVAEADRSLREGRWERGRFKGAELSGKVLGLVGAGRIGSAVAHRARAFGMSVIASDPYLPAERAQALDIEPVELDELLARADVITLHVPLTDATRGLIGVAQMARMKPGAVIVNAARGGVVDELALARALTGGHLGAAALDVFEEEPLSANHPLRQAPRLVMTPHLGASTAEAQHNVAIEIAEAVRDALALGDLGRALNAPAIGGEAFRQVRPLMALAERLGMLAQALAVGAPRTVEVRYGGAQEHALAALAASTVAGFLGGILGREAVNVVNAMYLAEGRGLAVSMTRAAPEADYPEQVEVRVTSAEGGTRVAGALLGESHERIVRIDDFHVDVRPAGTLIVLRNRDVPGVIGRVGTLLGEAGINIAEYHQARIESGGAALAAISVDGRPDASVLTRLTALPEVEGARVVALD